MKLPTAALSASGSTGLISAFRHPFQNGGKSTKIFGLRGYGDTFCGMVSIVPLARSPPRAHPPPHTALSLFVSCGIIEVSCLRHGPQTITAVLK